MTEFIKKSNMTRISEVYEFFDNIRDHLSKNFLMSTNITKDSLLQIVRKFRSDNPKEQWNKDIAAALGKILKLFKIRIFIEKTWLTKFSKNYNYIENNLYTLKTLINNSIKDIDDTVILKEVYKIENQILSTEFEEINCVSVKQVYGIPSLFIFIILANDNIICKGQNSFGQLGIGNFVSYTKWIDFTHSNVMISKNFKKISLGYAYSFFLTHNGNVYSCGAGENGRLGNNSVQNICIPQKVDIADEIIDISCGSTHTCFLTINNEVYTCGQKIYNGYSIHTDSLIPVKLDIKDIISVNIGTGGYHTICLTKYGKLKVWGHNRVGQLGISSEEIKKNVCKTDYMSADNHFELFSNFAHDEISNHVIIMKPQDIYFPKSIVKIAVGWGHTMILTMDKEV